MATKLEAVAGALGSNLSLSWAEAEFAGKKLPSSHQQTFASIDCG